MIAAIDVDFQLAAAGTEDVDELFYFYYLKKKGGPVGRTDRLQLTVVRVVRRNLGSIRFCSGLDWAVDTSATATAQHSTGERLTAFFRSDSRADVKTAI